MHHPTSLPRPHALPPSAAPKFVQPPEPMSLAFGAPVPYTRAPGKPSPPESPSPPGLTRELEEDLWSDSGESEVADLSDGADGDDDTDFVQSRLAVSRSRSRSRRSGAGGVSAGSGNGTATARASGGGDSRLGAPVPVPNLTKKSRGRRVPTAPVFIMQGGVQKNVRMYRCTVDGCYKCFARGEHLKRHVRSIHTNEKREYFCQLFQLCYLGF